MANESGSITLYNEAEDRLIFRWNIARQDYYTKKTVIYWRIYAHSNNQNTIFFEDVYLYLNGSVKMGLALQGAALDPGEELKEGSFTLTHSSRTSTYSMDLEFSATIRDDGSWNEYSDERSYTIPRVSTYPSFDWNFEQLTETTYRFDVYDLRGQYERVLLNIYDVVQDSLVYQYSDTDIGDDDFSITVPDGYLQEGTDYRFVLKLEDAERISDDYDIETTDLYPYCTSTPNFDIGNNLQLKFYNPRGRSMTITVIGDDNSVCYTYTSTSTSISGWNNATKYYQSIPNKKTGNYKVRVVTSVSDKTVNGGVYSTVEANCIPAISSISYLDSNSTTVAITGNNQKIIQSFSTVEFTFTSASAKNYATIDKIEAIINGVSQNVSGGGSSSGTYNLTYGTINSASNITATIKITDSRGYTKSYSKQITMLEYSVPQIQGSATRKQNFYSETTIRASASISSLNGGNSVTLKYSYKKITDGSYSAETVIQQYTDYTLNLDNTYEWNVKFKATDVLGSSELILKVGKGIPIVFFDRMLNATGFNCFPELQGGLYSEGYQIDNQIYIGSQTIYAGEFTQQNSTSSDVLSAFCTELINALFTGITIPDNYEKAFKLTALARTDNNFCKGWLTIGDVETKGIERKNNHSMTIPYWEVISSNIFKATELSMESNTMNVMVEQNNNGTSYSVESDDLLKIQSHSRFESDVFIFKDITIHAYLVKKNSTTPASILLNQDKVFLKQFGLDVAEVIYPNKRYEINTDSDTFVIKVYNGSTLEHTINYDTAGNKFTIVS